MECLGRDYGGENPPKGRGLEAGRHGREDSRQEAIGSREDLRLEGFREEAKGREASGEKVQGRRRKTRGSRRLGPRAAGFEKKFASLVV